MERRQKHFVLVHGANHGAWCWYKVATLLQVAGHRVTALDMAASGINPKPLVEVRSISDYAQPLLEFMDALPPENRVVLVGHSLGGAVIATAMESFHAKIAVAVFLAASMPGPDLPYLTIRQQIVRRIESFMDTKFTFDKGVDQSPNSILFGPEFLSSKLYQLSPLEDLTLATLLGRPSIHGELLQQPTLTKEKYGSVRRVYIVSDGDKVIPEDVQRWIIKSNPPDETKVVSGSDHMVMFSKPHELCSCLSQIAENYN